MIGKREKEHVCKNHQGVGIPCPNDNQVGRRGGRHLSGIHTLMKHPVDF